MVLSKAMTLVHVPTKGELVFEDGRLASHTVTEFFDKRGLTFKSCGLGMGDFFSYDAHPTQRGYLKLSDCVADVVRRLDDQAR